MQSITGATAKRYTGTLPLDESSMACWQHDINKEMIEIARLDALKKIFSKIFGITDCSDFVIDEFDRPVKIRQVNFQ